MPSSYTQSLRVEKQGTGENRGSWGTKANVSFDLFDEAIAGKKDIAMTDTNITLTSANAATDQSRPCFLRFTGGPLTANRTVTIPTVSKFYFMQNTMTGNFPLIISTGGATTVTLPPSGSPGVQWKLIFTDGTSVWSNDALFTPSNVAQRYTLAPFIAASGIMEVGNAIDFHNTNTNATDYNVRLGTGGFTTDLFINGYKVWHANNDGAASGLDADLLDGQHAADITFPEAPNDGKLYVRRVTSGVGAWIAIDAPWYIESATGDALLAFSGNIRVRIKTSGLILTENDIEAFSTTVG